jgi:plasmid maintenance system killer protein
MHEGVARWRVCPVPFQCGDRKGTCAVTVTGNWRVTFCCDGEDAVNVDLEDYHC